jgi:pyrimidine deaminase RibD-like protein
VLFDAVQAAKAPASVDYVIVDTAGRLQTKENLMAELQKMSRTAKKVIPDAPHEVLLVLDATTGQNGLEQARKFTETSGVTGIVLTKLDGTAKGGIVVAIARELNLPIRYIGVGEKVDDLLPFDAEKFIESLFENEPPNSCAKRWTWPEGPALASPNPMVGAVLVRDGEVVGRGFHTYAGRAARRNRRAGEAGDRARGATLYVNLEPCSHHGRTPPCADALIHAGVARVVAPIEDPNPLVAGAGISPSARGRHRSGNGAEFAAEAEKLNEPFLHFMRTGRRWSR